jgi:hypothetical protein
MRSAIPPDLTMTNIMGREHTGEDEDMWFWRMSTETGRNFRSQCGERAIITGIAHTERVDSRPRLVLMLLLLNGQA